jgi:IS605 OrfB family transposase
MYSYVDYNFMMAATKTLKVRVKDRHANALNRMARAVNFVWNYSNELSSRAISERGIFLSSYDIDRYTKGAGKELGLHSQTLQEVSKEYVIRRKQFKKRRLNWRKSTGSRRSLGWIPIKTGASHWSNGQVFHNGRYYKVFDSYGLSQYKFRSASFNEDARGRWYFNVVVEVAEKPSTATAAVGVDLGLKDIAATSDGEKLEAGHWYRGLEDKLAVAQRAGNRRRVRAIHAKIANRRKDALHKFSRKLVDRNAVIIVGDVASLKLAKSRMAKSVLDAGWGMLKTQLEYKCANANCVFIVVDEANTTQTCSSCGEKPDSRPKGIAGLGIREWTCSACGVTHDRDVNGARNILALGHERLAGGKVAA